MKYPKPTHRWVPHFLSGLAATCYLGVVVMGYILFEDIQAWLEPEYETSHIASDVYSCGIANSVNEAIENGWEVTEIGYDSCSNIYVYLRRPR
jgi:hypothetical protein